MNSSVHRLPERILIRYKFEMLNSRKLNRIVKYNSRNGS